MSGENLAAALALAAFAALIAAGWALQCTTP